jgi:hypothetical protein
MSKETQKHIEPEGRPHREALYLTICRLRGGFSIGYVPSQIVVAGGLVPQPILMVAWAVPIGRAC